MSKTLPGDPVASPDALLSGPAVAAMLGLSRRTLRQMVADKEFPEPIRINQRVVRWVAGDVRAWVQERRSTPRPADVVQAARAMGITLPARSLSK